MHCVSIDFEEISGKNLVVINSGLETTELSVTNWCSKVEELGAGEILVNSTTRDGLGGGYNLKFFPQITEKLKIPVIAQGGVGKWDHFGEALSNTNVDAVAAANIFHFYDQSVFIAKRWLFENGFNVRKQSYLIPKSIFHKCGTLNNAKNIRTRKIIRIRSIGKSV